VRYFVYFKQGIVRSRFSPVDKKAVQSQVNNVGRRIDLNLFSDFEHVFAGVLNTCSKS